MSKELEALKRITLKDFILNDDSSLNDIKIIEKALKDKEKTDKVLEIIKKNCDVESIIAFCTRNEKEQDLLKEVLTMTKQDLLMLTSLDTSKAERELEDLLPKLDVAGICSAKNGGNGWGITLTDFQINVLRELLKEVLL